MTFYFQLHVRSLGRWKTTLPKARPIPMALLDLRKTGGEGALTHTYLFDVPFSAGRSSAHHWKWSRCFHGQWKMQERGAMSVELRNSFWFSSKPCTLHIIWATYTEGILPKGFTKKMHTLHLEMSDIPATRRLYSLVNLRSDWGIWHSLALKCARQLWSFHTLRSGVRKDCWWPFISLPERCLSCKSSKIEIGTFHTIHRTFYSLDLKRFPLCPII